MSLVVMLQPADEPATVLQSPAAAAQQQRSQGRTAVLATEGVGVPVALPHPTLAVGGGRLVLFADLTNCVAVVQLQGELDELQPGGRALNQGSLSIMECRQLRVQQPLHTEPACAQGPHAAPTKPSSGCLCQQTKLPGTTCLTLPRQSSLYRLCCLRQLGPPLCRALKVLNAGSERNADMKLGLSPATLSGTQHTNFVPPAVTSCCSEAFSADTQQMLAASRATVCAACLAVAAAAAALNQNVLVYG